MQRYTSGHIFGPDPYWDGGAHTIRSGACKGCCHASLRTHGLTISCSTSAGYHGNPGFGQFPGQVASVSSEERKEICSFYTQCSLQKKPWVIKRLRLSLAVLKMVTSFFNGFTHTHTYTHIRERGTSCGSTQVSESLLLNLLGSFLRGWIKRLSWKFSRISEDILQVKPRHKQEGHYARPTLSLLLNHSFCDSAKYELENWKQQKQTKTSPIHNHATYVNTVTI